MLKSVINAAIFDMATDNSTSPLALNSILLKWLGNDSLPFGSLILPDFRYLPIPRWPDESELMEANSGGSGLVSILSEANRVVIGTNSLTNVPKRFNMSSIPGTSYYAASGFEVDIAESIFTRISRKYPSVFARDGDPLQVVWALSPWFDSAQDNIISNLDLGKYDVILSGMSSLGTWIVEGPGGQDQTVARDSVLQFSLPYLNGGAAGILVGLRPLPANVSTPITNLTMLNQEGVITCVQRGTSMAEFAERNLNRTMINDYADGSQPRKETLNQNCNMYLAPIVNAAWDARAFAGNLTLVLEYSDKAYFQSYDPISIGIRLDRSTVEIV